MEHSDVAWHVCVHSYVVCNAQHARLCTRCVHKASKVVRVLPCLSDTRRSWLPSLTSWSHLQSSLRHSRHLCARAPAGQTCVVFFTVRHICMPTFTSRISSYVFTASSLRPVNSLVSLFILSNTFDSSRYVPIWVVHLSYFRRSNPGVYPRL